MPRQPVGSWGKKLVLGRGGEAQGERVLVITLVCWAITPRNQSHTEASTPPRRLPAGHKPRSHHHHEGLETMSKTRLPREGKGGAAPLQPFCFEVLSVPLAKLETTIRLGGGMVDVLPA